MKTISLVDEVRFAIEMRACNGVLARHVEVKSRERIRCTIEAQRGTGARAKP